jgi:hypothetical protein
LRRPSESAVLCHLESCAARRTHLAALARWRANIIVLLVLLKSSRRSRVPDLQIKAETLPIKLTKQAMALQTAVDPPRRPIAPRPWWGLDLVRCDIKPKSPTVAQIYCRDKGNVFRLVNHACGNSASAVVQFERITGIFAPIFYARRDIKDGDEIQRVD